MKKIIGYLVIVLLFAGSICGIVFGVKYAQNEKYIQDNNSAIEQVEELRDKITTLQIELQNKEIVVVNLTEQLNTSLANGGLKDEEIEDLKNDIAELQADISAKQAQIAELQDDIKFYQELLEAYEDSGKLVVTFTLVDNGVETTHDVQVVEPNGYLTAVVNPTASDFEGWSLSKGGELIEDLTTVQVTENMTVYGMFTNTVTFMVNGEEYATQEVSYNKYATDVEVSLAGYNLDGWSLTEDGETVTLSTTSITADTTFYAVLEKLDFYPVSLSGIDNFGAQYVWTDGISTYYSHGTEQYVLNEETSTWVQKAWNGLSNLNGNCIWRDNNATYYLYNGEQYILDGFTSTWSVYELTITSNSLDGFCVWTDGENIYCSDSISNYIWEDRGYGKQWFIATIEMPNITQSGSFVWTDGNYTYLSELGNYQYVWDKGSDSWLVKTWNGLTNFRSSHKWSDGQNTYYSEYTKQYILNEETSTWEEKVWSGLSNFSGQDIWTDGENYYCSNGGSQYILNI